MRTGGQPDRGVFGIVRPVAMVLVVAAAAGSIVLMLRAGHRNPSSLLLALFTGWVLSPFAALISIGIVSRRCSAPIQVILHCTSLIIAASSLAAYGNVVSLAPASKPAFVFLVVPLSSWFLLAICVPLAVVMPGRLSRRGGRGSGVA